MKYILNLGRNSENILKEAENIYGKAEKIFIIKRENDSLEIPIYLKSLENKYSKGLKETIEDFTKWFTPVIYIANGGTTEQLWEMARFVYENNTPMIRVIDLQKDSEKILYNGKWFTDKLIKLETTEILIKKIYFQTSKSSSSDGRRNDYESYSEENWKKEKINIRTGFNGKTHEVIIEPNLKGETVKIGKYMFEVKDIIAKSSKIGRDYRDDVLIKDKNNNIYRIEIHNGDVI